VCAWLSGGAILHLSLLVSVCLCCKSLSLSRLHAISVVTMVCDRLVDWLTCPILSSPHPLCIHRTYMRVWDTSDVVVGTEYGFLASGVKSGGGGWTA